MKKRYIVGAITAGLLLIGALNQSHNQQSLDNTKSFTSSPTATKAKPVAKPTCNGTSVTSGCVLENISYKTYIYHPAVPERTHTENTTTYEEKIVGTCTLCNDGSLSPTCAVGRGACSHHGGVAQYGYQVTQKVPTTTSHVVVDSPAQEAYYEKVAE